MNIACIGKPREKRSNTKMNISSRFVIRLVRWLNKKCFCRIHTKLAVTPKLSDSTAVMKQNEGRVLQSRNKCLPLTNKERATWGFISPDNNIGSFSCDFLTWSDSPVSELSSIFRSLPWRRTPSAGKRSPERQHITKHIFNLEEPWCNKSVLL